MSDPSRLVIKSMTLHNFKSYAGTHKVGPFNKSFTAVVGPNGNGKSNILDALLFVFGFKAKSLRQSKLSDLIHRSAKHKDFTDAYVAIEFGLYREVNDTFDDTFVVKRSISADSKSQYYYNDIPKTQKEVTTLLKRYNLDLTNNRFLILQGEVENISMMKPKAEKPDEVGLLEYLEEVIGTNKYIPEIDQLKKEREASEFDFLVSQKNYFSAEEMLESYAEPFAEAIKLLKLKSERLIFQNLSIQKKIYDIEQKIVANKDEYTLLKQELEEVSSQLAEVQTLDRSFITKIQALNAELKNLNTQKNSENSRLNEVLSNRNHFTNIMNEIDSTITKINAERTQYENLINENTLKLTALSNLEKTSTTDLPILKRVLTSTTNEMTKLNEQFGHLLAPIIAERERLETDMGPLQDSIFDHQKKIQDISSFCEAIQHKNELLNEELKTVTLNEEIHNRGRSLTAKKQELTAELASINSQSSNFMKAESEKTREYNLISRKLASLKNAAVEQKNESKAITALKSIEGVHGRLGDLGQINSELLPAFVAAAGGVLEFVVVDTVSVAERCIKILKERNSGICSFLVLEKISRNIDYNLRNYMSRGGENKCPVNSSRDFIQKIASEHHFLLDLISFKKELFAAWVYALRETKLAVNLASASNIRGKVVTLRGEIIDPSGAMTGGGNIQSLLKRSGGIKTEKNHVTFSDDSDEINMITEKIDLLKREITNIQQESAAFKSKQESLNTELLSIERELNDLQRQLVQCRSADIITGEIHQNNAQYQEKLNERAQQEQLLASVQQDLTSFTEQLEQNSRKFDENGGKKIRLAQKEIDSLNKKISDIENKLKNAKNEETRLTSLISLNQGKFDATVSKLEQLQAKRSESEIALNDVIKSIAAIEESVANIVKLYDEKKVEISNLNSENSENKTKIIQLTESQAEIKASIKSIDNANNVHRSHISENKRQLQNVKQEINYINSLEIGEDLDLKDLIVDNLELKISDSLEASFSEEDFTKFEEKNLLKHIANIESQIEVLANSADMTSIQVYKEKKEVVNSLKSDFMERNQKNNEIIEKLQKVERLRTDEFKTAFDYINRELQKIYRLLTISGSADLSLFDFMNPFSEGIGFNVFPPKKSWRPIQNLSGGEKTIASLALLFALHNFRENPLYIMDEIDAALDFRNVSIVASYILERTKNSQFIVISLRNNMFELAETLIGVYKNDGCTRSICIDVAEMAAMALKERNQ